MFYAPINRHLQPQSDTCVICLYAFFAKTREELIERGWGEDGRGTGEER